jgi:hypothetical protein
MITTQVICLYDIFDSAGHEAGRTGGGGKMGKIKNLGIVDCFCRAIYEDEDGNLFVWEDGGRNYLGEEETLQTRDYIANS